MTFNDLVAQMAHLAWGALLIDALAARMKWYYAVLIVVAFYVGKEVVESTIGVWEPVQPWSSGLEDMAYWTIGVVLGLIIGHYWERLY